MAAGASAVAMGLHLLRGPDADPDDVDVLKARAPLFREAVGATHGPSIT